VSRVASAGYLATKSSRAAGDRPDLDASSVTLQRTERHVRSQSRGCYKLVEDLTAGTVESHCREAQELYHSQLEVQTLDT
jgi:hypothetical protein